MSLIVSSAAFKPTPPLHPSPYSLLPCLQTYPSLPSFPLFSTSLPSNLPHPPSFPLFSTSSHPQPFSLNLYQNCCERLRSVQSKTSRSCALLPHKRWTVEHCKVTKQMTSKCFCLSSINSLFFIVYSVNHIIYTTHTQKHLKNKSGFSFGYDLSKLATERH